MELNNFTALFFNEKSLLVNTEGHKDFSDKHLDWSIWASVCSFQPFKHEHLVHSWEWVRIQHGPPGLISAKQPKYITFKISLWWKTGVFCFFCWLMCSLEFSWIPDFYLDNW